ncbi:hypothetical protein TFLX_03894 [Thermoflexales bacterium]|nr:hypothetical protein TFLX_03894 [Thermoflexales bacterium]
MSYLRLYHLVESLPARAGGGADQSHDPVRVCHGERHHAKDVVVQRIEDGLMGREEVVFK